MYCSSLSKIRIPDSVEKVGQFLFLGAGKPYLFSVFANMLSEGENRHVQSVLLRIDPEDDFGILLATCQIDTIGAITVKPIRL